ncbi:hypothetical protein SASPL_150870 [Salvia splendens]|uniref:Uncharacterized protein n=1 Tax=Salvia splendens TaxID=180675 RepID=A0A8X8Z379_SALSN|nr:hypothetical protein SASPL_150870 [Salvia splendens]
MRGSQSIEEETSESFLFLCVCDVNSFLLNFFERFNSVNIQVGDQDLEDSGFTDIYLSDLIGRGCRRTKGGAMDRNIPHSTNKDGLLVRSESKSAATTSSDFVLQWGNRKRLRCMKFQAKDHTNNNSIPVQRATTRIDRRVVRSDLIKREDPNSNQLNTNKSNGGGNGYLNLRQRPASPSHRILRNSESSLGMRGHSNGVRGLTSPERGEKRGGTTGNKKGGSSSGGDTTILAMWPPKFVIALTNKEKEEDFMAIKGSKLPQRPKKRAKFIQRTLNLVSPGAWLCDLTLERYEVREKKVSKKTKRVEGDGKRGVGFRVEGKIWTW